MDVLIIYQFCAFGGVERAILNRVQVFKRYHLDIKVSVGYLRDDGALAAFRKYIHRHGLEEHLDAFILKQASNHDWSRYDLVTVIDTPGILEQLPARGNLFVECHTPYTPNRQYLKHLPGNIRGILVPSESFRRLLLWEFRGLPPVHVLPNPVSEELFLPLPDKTDWEFTQPPLVYMARLDEIKNYTEAASVFKSLADQELSFLALGYGAEDEKRNQPFRETGLQDRLTLREKITFDEVPGLIGQVKRQRGVFLSPSRGESFGLSAAEFISAGVPVLLSDIAPHRELVHGDENFLYSLGDVDMARVKLLGLFQDWDAASEKMLFYGFKFRGDAFHSAWINFLAQQHLETLVTPKS